MQNRTRPIGARSIVAAASLVIAAGFAGAHDEDWRKLVDKVGPVEGPIWRLGDPTPRNGGFDASGVTCLSNIPPNNFSAGSIEAQDCWGYVSPSGREYAILCLYNGFGYVEVTDPTNPVIISFINGAQSSWHDVKIVGTYAYGVSEGGLGVQVMDLSDIDNGNVTLVRNSTLGGHSSTHNIVSNEATGSLWLVGANIGNGGLVHLDLSDPTRPTPSGGWTDMYVHDAQVVTPTSGPFAGREIAFCFSGLDGGFTSTGLRIVDVTNPASPQLLATHFYANAGYSHQGWATEDLQYLFLNDELDEDFGLVGQTTTRIIDISDLTNPVNAGTFSTGLPSIDHNLYTVGPYIFQANYRTGLRIFDGTNPLSPTEIAYFDSYPGSDSAAFNGAWSNYPYLPSGNILLSDIERGLFVLRVDALDLERLDLSVPGELPELISPNGGDTVTLAVDEINLTADGSTAELIFDDGSGPVTVAGAPGAVPGQYDFTLPTADCGDATYYFSIQDTLGEVFTLPGNAPASAFSAIVADEALTAFEDNFQTNTGWSVSGSAANAGEGRWERATPTGAGQRGDPASDADGSGLCYITGNGSPGANTDVDATTVLTSPAYNVTSPEARIRYQRWYNNAFGSNPGVETMEVEISNNNGSTWTPLETVGPTGGEASGGWFTAEFRIADFVSPSSSVRVRFTATDNIGAVIEAGVDDFEIFEYLCDPAPVCFADCDGSGGLNIDDIECFATAFIGGDLGAADCDGSGMLNIDDIECFSTSFLAGCP